MESVGITCVGVVTGYFGVILRPDLHSERREHGSLIPIYFIFGYISTSYLVNDLKKQRDVTHTFRPICIKSQQNFLQCLQIE